ncbi:MAG: N-formylglutamate amidohydrolase, partial [Deltaproteobacteria bacterium]|nr:N-formylglutamate amidohydrolase [Nannocystaceae bacterium]
GALELATRLARSLSVELFAATVTRLLVDLNRSAGHPAVFSRWSAALPEAEREQLLARWHTPHRTAIREAVASAVEGGAAVMHVAVHSFTPVLDGVRRNADIGLLYDPGRLRERAFASRWRSALRETAPSLRVRSNYPYRGVSDGLTRWLRRSFADAVYAGLELEMNQDLIGEPERWRDATRAIDSSLRACLD